MKAIVTRGSEAQIKVQYNWIWQLGEIDLESNQSVSVRPSVMHAPVCRARGLPVLLVSDACEAGGGIGCHAEHKESQQVGCNQSRCRHGCPGPGASARVAYEWVEPKNDQKKNNGSTQQSCYTIFYVLILDS